MEISSQINEFWKEFCETNSQINPDESFQVWFFGKTSEMARELAELVISGKKTATASLVEFNEKFPDAAPLADGYSVVTNFEDVPVCVIQTTEIRHLPFGEVNAQFASDEGEGDQSLEDWRERHRRYFTREAAENNFKFNEKSLVCCERFRLLFPK